VADTAEEVTIEEAIRKEIATKWAMLRANFKTKRAAHPLISPARMKREQEDIVGVEAAVDSEETTTVTREAKVVLILSTETRALT